MAKLSKSIRFKVTAKAMAPTNLRLKDIGLPMPERFGLDSSELSTQERKILQIILQFHHSTREAASIMRSIRQRGENFNLELISRYKHSRDRSCLFRILTHLCVAYNIFQRHGHPNSPLRYVCNFPRGVLSTKAIPSKAELDQLSTWYYNLKKKDATMFNLFTRFSQPQKIAKYYTTDEFAHNYSLKKVENIISCQRDYNFTKFVSKLRSRSTEGTSNSFSIRRLSARYTALPKAARIPATASLYFTVETALESIKKMGIDVPDSALNSTGPTKANTAAVPTSTTAPASPAARAASSTAPLPPPATSSSGPTFSSSEIQLLQQLIKHAPHLLQGVPDAQRRAEDQQPPQHRASAETAACQRPARARKEMMSSFTSASSNMDSSRSPPACQQHSLSSDSTYGSHRLQLICRSKVSSPSDSSSFDTAAESASPCSISTIHPCDSRQGAAWKSSKGSLTSMDSRCSNHLFSSTPRSTTSSPSFASNRASVATVSRKEAIVKEKKKLQDIPSKSPASHHSKKRQRSESPESRIKTQSRPSRSKKPKKDHHHTEKVSKDKVDHARSEKSSTQEKKKEGRKPLSTRIERRHSGHRVKMLGDKHSSDMNDKPQVEGTQPRTRNPRSRARDRNPMSRGRDTPWSMVL